MKTASGKESGFFDLEGIKYQYGVVGKTDEIRIDNFIITSPKL